MSEKSKICTFYIDEHLFGVDVYKIQEVLRYQEMTDVPLAGDAISGLINLRGQIVTAINMRNRLELPQASHIQPANIIIRSDDGAVSLLVDEIGDVIDIRNDRFEKPPENLSGAICTMLEKVCSHEDRLLLFLDLNQVINME